MIEITDGLTNVSAGADSIEAPDRTYPCESDAAFAPRRPTGARVTVEFQRTASLSPAQVVTVRYDFAGDGTFRELVGIPKSIRTVVRQGRAVVYHYRMSHWIPASAVMDSAGEARSRIDALRAPGEPQAVSERNRPQAPRVVAVATAVDPSPA
jgi:hypothetical protein